MDIFYGSDQFEELTECASIIKKLLTQAVPHKALFC